MEPIFSFVEYLVGGSVGLLWLIPIVLHLLALDKFEINVGFSEGGFALIFSYALGIFLDRASSFLLNPGSSLGKTSEGLKKLRTNYISLIKKTVSLENNETDGSNDNNKSSPVENQKNSTASRKEGAYFKTAKILALAPESLAQTTQAYVGRERIARVMLLNSVAGLIVAISLQRSFFALHILLVLAAAWSLLTWAELQTLSEQFKKKAINEIVASHSKNLG
jgi:hypothetical protein